MRLLRRGCGYLLSEVLCGLFMCGGAWALPQDWPCEEVEVVYERDVFDGLGAKREVYHGEAEGVSVEVSFLADDGEVSFDCGNQGCSGVFYNLATGEREEMDFYCESKENGRAVCAPVNWRQLRLSLADDGVYRLSVCGQKLVYALDLKECEGCRCVLEKVDESGRHEEIERVCVPVSLREAVDCFDAYGVEALGTKICEE